MVKNPTFSSPMINVIAMAPIVPKARNSISAASLVFHRVDMQCSSVLLGKGTNTKGREPGLECPSGGAVNLKM